MDQFEENLRNYWDYFLELEAEFVETKKYVDFSKENYSTFSIEFLKLFQAICSEIDVLGKAIASKINPSFPNNGKSNIQKWWIEIQDYADFYLELNTFHEPSASPVGLCDADVRNYLMNETFSPWSNFKLEYFKNKKNETRIRLKGSSKTPKWWTAYNKVKHDRTGHDKNGGINFKKACLENICESISALYVFEILILELSNPTREQCQSFLNESKVFSKKEFASYVDMDALFLGQ